MLIRGSGIEDWSPDFGGCLVDAAGPQAIVPEYNSLIAFLVPREHWVSEMKSGAPARYTLFGWLHDREPYGDELQPLGWASKDLLESQVGDAKVAREHVEAAKEACEHGFRMHFGIDKDSLRLGAPNSPAKQLLRRLAG
ncbi:unnamed protein product [Effrenium voratum]|nr:unnamed protein product [Effrenium voratum]